MAQDIRKLFEETQNKEEIQMPKGHRNRFMDRLDQEFPKEEPVKNRSWMYVAASIVVLVGLVYSGFKWMDGKPVDTNPQVVDTKTETNKEETKSLGDVSPELKQVEDYYLASINFELSKVKVTPENKELFDGYVKRLEELNGEYQKLSVELTEKGPNEFTVTALINNLKLRLNLLHRLREQLKLLNENQYNQKTS